MTGFYMKCNPGKKWAKKLGKFDFYYKLLPGPFNVQSKADYIL